MNAPHKPKAPTARRKSRCRPNAGAAARSLGRLFWDRDLKPADIREHPRWVVERALEYGSLKDLETLIALLGRGRFLELAGCARFTTERTAEFWRQMLKLEGVTCTTKFSRPIAWRS